MSIIERSRNAATPCPLSAPPITVIRAIRTAKADGSGAIGTKRLVIDSLAGFEMALTPAFRSEFRESHYRMIGAFTGAGITILSAV